MYKLRILSVGKTKETWLEMAINEYLKRLQKMAVIEFAFFKNDEQLEQMVKKEEAVICLDSTGQLMNSPEFSSFLHKELENNGSRLSFVIGGAEGLPPRLKQGYPLLSFSPMTFTHQIIRLILIEQIYRAIEIGKGTRYHK